MAGIVSTFAGSGSSSFSDGVGTAASIYNVRGITSDTMGNVYVSTASHYRIRRITSSGAAMQCFYALGGQLLIHNR